MKNYLLSALLLFSLCCILTACPVDVPHPLGVPGNEKIDNGLVGIWVNDSTGMEAQKVEVRKKDNYSYTVQVIEKGEMYSVEGVHFNAWVTGLSGKKFICLQEINSSGGYFTYCYELIGDNTLKTWDVGLKNGGVDAVTSTEAYRTEVSTSLTYPDCLSSEIVWRREK